MREENKIEQPKSSNIKKCGSHSTRIGNSHGNTTPQYNTDIKFNCLPNPSIHMVA